MRISIQGTGIYVNRERGQCIDPIHIDDPLFPTNNVGRNCFRIHQCIKNSIENIVIHFFQLPLSLRKLSLDPNYVEMLPSSCQRLLFTLETFMLMFASKIYQIPNLNDFLTSVARISDDKYLRIGDDLQLYVKPQAVLKEFGSATDHGAASRLRELHHIPDKLDTDDLALNVDTLFLLDTDLLLLQVQQLIVELDEILAHDVVDEAGAWKNKLREQSHQLFDFLPEAIHEQLMLERDQHGNVQVAKIETEKNAHSNG